MLLEARNLHIGYGDAPAVWDVSLEVDGGEIVAVIGPNGAGKTTLINAIAGLLRCRRGELRFDGADMTRINAHAYCSHGIALVPEGRRLFAKMSVEENLELGCYLRSARTARKEVERSFRTRNGMSEEEYLQWCIKNLEHAFIAQVDPESVAAIIIEPVLGEGGFIQMPTAFMQKIRELCDKHGIVMIADEIQSGSGRTGKLFAIEHTGVVPDVMTIAKSLGAGMPVSAVVGKAEIMDCTHLGGVGGTYGGSPVAAVAAIEALKILSSKEFLDRSTHVGNLIKSTLDSWKEKFAMVGDVRATGAMCIVEFVKDKNSKEPDMEIPLEVLKDAVAHGIILIRAGLYSNCIRLLPPIVMTDEQLHEGLQVLEDAIARAHEKRGK